MRILIKEYWLVLSLFCLVGFAAFEAWQLIDFYKFKTGDFVHKDVTRSEFGVIGDFFGGVLNPFFSLLGLLMLLATLIQNQKELSLSRLELKESSKALKEQAETLNKQRFEDTFFSLLNQHNACLEKIVADQVRSLPLNPQSITTDIFGRIYRKTYGTVESISAVEAKEKLIQYNDFVNQYFRVLYQLLKLIATSCPNTNVGSDFSIFTLDKTVASKEEKTYSNIVRAFLTAEIYYLLAINCYCKSNTDSFIKYKLLIERYAFLEHMPKFNNDSSFRSELVTEIIASYDKNALGDNTSLT